MLDLVWRTGRRNKRNLYAQRGPEPADDDMCIGLVDSPSLAERIVADHNTRLWKQPPPERIMGPEQESNGS